SRSCPWRPSWPVRLQRGGAAVLRREPSRAVGLAGQPVHLDEGRGCGRDGGTADPHPRRPRAVGQPAGQVGGPGPGAGIPGPNGNPADLGPAPPVAVLPDFHPAPVAQLARAGIVHPRRLWRRRHGVPAGLADRFRGHAPGRGVPRRCAGARHRLLHGVPGRSSQGPRLVAEPAAGTASCRAGGGDRRRGAAVRCRDRPRAPGGGRDHHHAPDRARPPGRQGDDAGPVRPVLLARPHRRSCGDRRAVGRRGRRPVRAARPACARARLRAGWPVGAARLVRESEAHLPGPADVPAGGIPDLAALGARVSAARAAAQARGETFYQGDSRVHLAAFPTRERWDDWVELSSRAWPAREEHHYMLVPTTCFNCESACGLLAYVARETRQDPKFEGNPEHPGSRGRNCAKGPATINQVTDPDRVLYPMRRAGRRGEGRWERITWDEALDAIAARIRAALTEGRNNEIMVHLGRPGEDGYTERVLASWGVDGHNSHTNVCSSGGRTGFQFWMGMDRPSPDYAHAKVIYLISAHLETGHYFNPHAQRITQARENGAKVIVLDTRLSNTATHADFWLSPQPGSEAAMNLAIASYLIRTGQYDSEFVRRWWNWEQYLTQCRPDLPPTFEA